MQLLTRAVKTNVDTEEILVPTACMHTQCLLPDMLLSNKDVSQTLILFSVLTYIYCMPLLQRAHYIPWATANSMK